MNKKNVELFDIVNVIVMLIITIVTVYPLVYVVSVSLSSPEFVRANMVTLLPKGFNYDAYTQVFKNTLFWGSYKNTLIYTTLGTLINITLTAMLAFSLSRKELIFRKPLTLFFIFTMFFSGGLIPDFLLIKSLGMYNTIWAVIIPGAISTYNMIIVRTFMSGIPEEIYESVRMDGGNDLQIFIKMALPLSKAVIVTVALFYAVGHWNSFFGPMIYLKDRVKMPLQVILKDMVTDNNIQGMLEEATDHIPATSDMVVSASIVVALVPILAVYPFVQKYFVQGVMIGSVKG